MTWEDSEKPPLPLFVETAETDQDGLWADANGFLVGAILAAWHAGERRVKIEGEVCPVLCNNLRAACMTLRSWYPEMGTPPVIEPSLGFKAYLPFRSQAASFLSCGIDSLATLRANKLDLAREHPASIGAVFLIDFSGATFMTEQEARNTKRIVAASRAAGDVEVVSIPVTTNLLSLDSDGWFFTYKWHGAVLSSVAYFFSRRFDKAYIASTYDVAHLEPWGSHPLLDPFYSSSYLQIEHHGLYMSRLEKTALIAEWPAGLQNILVCQGRDGGETNCGACEKCIRTMTALVALGKLKGCGAFPVDDVSPALLRTVQDYEMIYNESQAAYYQELIPALAKCRRDDLVLVIEELVKSQSQKRTQGELLAKDLAELVPLGEDFILVDKDQFGCKVEAQSRGRYWGPPPDSGTAIRELEELRQSGAKFLFFHEPGFWWLDYYRAFDEHLTRNFQRVRKDSRFIVFDLRK